MLNKHKISLIAIFFLIVSSAHSQMDTITQNINWDNYKTFWIGQESEKVLSFNYLLDYEIDELALYNNQYILLSKSDSTHLLNFEINNKEIIYEYDIAKSKNKTVLNITISPLIKNELGLIQKINHFELVIKKKATQSSLTTHQKSTTQSLLADGNWYKIAIDTTGVFKITYDEIIALGITDPSNVSLYGYGGKQLPYMNNDFNYDDLVENPIYIEKGTDGTFGPGDFLLFYGEGPVTWSYDNSSDFFLHHIHEYSHESFYYITSDRAPEKNWKTVDNNQLESDQLSTSYDSYRYHEQNTSNLVRSGRIWWGEKFRQNDRYTFDFDFKNLLDKTEVIGLTSIAARKASGSAQSIFTITQDEELLTEIKVTGNYGTYTWGYENSGNFKFSPSSPKVSIKYTYTGGDASSEGVLDYLCLNTRENIVFDGTNQLLFRDKDVAIPGQITQFKIKNNSSKFQVWNITNPLSAYQLSTESDQNNILFKEKTDSIIEFVVFNPDHCFSPRLSGENIGKVENQNLHAIDIPEFLIVSHPDFLKQAEELAEIHREFDNMNVFITTPEKIYNEFSSGMKDVSAIRNFARMLYHNDNNGEPTFKYLLLLGDGSYDNKTISNTNSNLIPTYQSLESLSETTSFVTDDFFGLLDMDEGGSNGALDIGIGRYPVSDSSAAAAINNKIRIYLSDASNDYWRNQICFIGDDDDGNTHMRQPDEIAGILTEDYPQYNINKIFFDAYPRLSTPMGHRYPDVTKAINEQIKKGALIIDYVGHGNPRLLAHEEVLTVPDVKSWKNINKLGIFVTASCEVGRYDDYERISMGEWFVLNPDGGSVATLTTTRVVYSNLNHNLNKSFFQHVLNPENRLGDVIRLAKTSTTDKINKRNFSLLGDPALRLAVPKNVAKVQYINDHYVMEDSKKQGEHIELTSLNIPSDTLNALSKANVAGEILDENGQILSDFNGTLQISIYDKPDSIVCYGQTSAEDALPFSFDVQNSVLYQGQAKITNGSFDFDFIIPKDINYKYGNGKISLYAKSDSINAIGYSNNFVIGGISDEFEIDTEGPEISLFINDTLFIGGGTTNEDPILIANLYDESGINTTGIGVGHNITAIFDNDYSTSILLNSFYQGNVDEYNSGEINYPFYGLEEGQHTLSLKVWDIYNNSSEKEIEFVVKNSEQVVVNSLQNEPNPFWDETWFTFEHNQTGELDINIKVYNLMGYLVAQINDKQNNSGFNIIPIHWDGTSVGGSKLSKGMYVYRIEINTIDGQLHTQSSKLMIFE